MPYRKLTRDEHLFGPGPKRILALDGGGLRGILTLGFLAKIEAVLRRRHGDDPDFRLCHYFDLIAGTSTGSIIGSFISIGLSVDEIIAIYLRLGRDVFQKSFWRDGKIRERYDDELLSEHLRAVLGDYTAIGSKKLHRGLLVITKRLDTGSPWPLGNNPRGQFFAAPAGATWISNGEYPLWQVVRASTAAPTFFSPEKMKIGQSATLEPLEGEFVDGGVSPFNDPSLQALMYTTMKGYGIRWRTGARQLQVVSVGTGSEDPKRDPERIAVMGALASLQSLMDDCAALMKTMMQWISTSPTAEVIDSEIGDLSQNLLGGSDLITYMRYNIVLNRRAIDPLVPGLPDDVVHSLHEMDDPDNLLLLKELGELAAEVQVHDDHFSDWFDLPQEAPENGERRQYRKRPDAIVTAVRLAFDTDGFTYRRYGGDQRCKRGDWIVHDGGEPHTVDHESFVRTYEEVSPGRYLKTAPVWAEVATQDGEVGTLEGVTRYRAGDYVVSNDEAGLDTYAMKAVYFERMYEPL